jgi:hypothetical protein
MKLQFIQLFHACYAQVLGKKPDEKTQLQVLGIDWQDGLTMRVRKSEITTEAFEKTCEKCGARMFKTTSNYSIKFSSLQETIEASQQAQPKH